MDSMVQFYMEETEDLLQKAEECIIRLEMEYSHADVNELFRIAHTIKGSSQLVGYEDIGKVMHKIEDMLDCVRNGSLMFDQNIVSHCFNGLDIVKKMLQYKKEQGSQEMTKDLADAASEISEKVEAFIRANKNKDEKTGVKQSDEEIVSFLLNKKPTGRNRFYITFFIEEDAPMVSPVFIMILKSIEDIGALVYSSITDSYFSDCSVDDEIKELSIILCTDIDETELYTYFALPYLEKINIVDLTRSKLEENDHYFNSNEDNSYIILLGVFIRLYNILSDRFEDFIFNIDGRQIIESLRSEAVSAFNKMKDKNKISTFIKDFNKFYSLVIKVYDRQLPINAELCKSLRMQMVKLIERANNYIKGKHIFRVFKPEANDFADRLKNFVEMVDNSSTLVILIDLSNLDTLDEDEIKTLVKVKNRMKAQNIELGIIAARPDARRIINIFDSIKSVEDFKLFKSETDAILEILYSRDSMHKIAERMKNVG